MATDIVKSLNDTLTIFYEEEREAGNIILNIIARFLEPVLVSDEEPLLGENGPSLNLVDGRRAIPARRERGILAAVCVSNKTRHGFG